MHEIFISQLVFQPKPDKLGLVPPAWTTSLTFANQEDSRKFLVGTAEHTWRLYDVAAQRRPVMVVPFGESSIKSIAASRDGFSLFLGNGTGNLAQFDIRTGRSHKLLLFHFFLG